jgi:hypothetical protein
VLKKLLIPVFAFTVAAIGCSGGSNNTTDGGNGTAGSTGGSSGGAASASGGAAGGGAGGSSGRTAGASGGAAGASGGGAGSDAGSGDDIFAPVCTLETFCPIFLEYCGTTTPGYTTLAECMTTYAAIGAATPNKQQCETFHLCNAIYDTGSDRTLHCGHAAGGGGVCDQTD